MPTLRLPSVIPGVKSTSATVRRWLKAPGTRVAKGEVLVEMELEEGVLQLEAPGDGTLGTPLLTAGQTAPLGAPLAELGGAAAAATPVPAVSSNGSETKASSMSNPVNVIPILMPQAGNSMEEGTILKWRVREGDRVAVGQILYEVETDKATVEVEATDAGRVAKIVAPEGSVIPVKQPVAYLAEQDADVAAFVAAPAAASAQPTATEAAAVAAPVAAAAATGGLAVVVGEGGGGGRVKVSPAARKLAKEKGLDLATVGAGSGPEGRIVTSDLLRARPAAAAVPALSRATGVVRKPLSKMRKAIATNLQMSKQTVPHFYVRQTVNADPLFAFYRAQKPATGCTLNDVILLAVGRTVGEFGAFRSRVEGNELVELPTANIGVAVSVAEGLVVPVVMNIDSLSLAQLAPEAKRVVEAARAGKIENMGKGVFTISNMGMLGVEEFAAIINPPESGILAISAVREDVLVKDGAMRAGKVMTLTLSVDHRVVDGALAAAFMAKLKEYLEKPELLLQHS